MAKVLMLVHDGVEDREMAYPYYRMQEAGYTVEVVGDVGPKRSRRSRRRVVRSSPSWIG